jgi:hypothetical protein
MRATTVSRWFRRLAISALAALVLWSALPAIGPLSLAAFDDNRASAPPEPAANSAASAADGIAAKGGQRIREGDKLADQVGSFKLTGDRLTFFTADGSRRFNGLENLNLERITQMVGDSPDPLEWRVSGIVTEYRGANYLLITQAVVKNKPGRATTTTP